MGSGHHDGTLWREATKRYVGNALHDRNRVVWCLVNFGNTTHVDVCGEKAKINHTISIENGHSWYSW